MDIIYLSITEKNFFFLSIIDLQYCVLGVQHSDLGFFADSIPAILSIILCAMQ